MIRKLKIENLLFEVHLKDNIDNRFTLVITVDDLEKYVEESIKFSLNVLRLDPDYSVAHEKPFAEARNENPSSAVQCFVWRGNALRS